MTETPIHTIHVWNVAVYNTWEAAQAALLGLGLGSKLSADLDVKEV